MKVKISIGERLPDFKSKIPLTLLNGDTSDLTMTFRHLSQTEFNDEMEKLKGEIMAGGDADFGVKMANQTNAKMVMIIASGWDLEDEFTQENIATLFDFHPNILQQIMNHYQSAKAGDRVKN